MHGKGRKRAFVLKRKSPLYVEYHGEKVCIADDGYQWLQQFPSNGDHSVTTMFDSQGRIIKWLLGPANLFPQQTINLTL